LGLLVWLWHCLLDVEGLLSGIDVIILLRVGKASKLADTALLLSRQHVH
jgi:hypothetical protein